jgi:hypothetical protein
MSCLQQEIDMIRCSTESLHTVISTSKDHIQKKLMESVSLKKRAQELERDKCIVMAAEDTAVCEKIIAEKKLVEIGGHDSAIRFLKKTLDMSNQELDETTSKYFERIVMEKSYIHTCLLCTR